VLVVATVWLSGGKLRDRTYWPLLLTVAAGTASAILLKLALVAWAVGPREMITDFFFQLEERATAKHSTDYRGAFWLILVHRSLRFFTPLVFVIFAAHIAALAFRIVKRRASTSLPPPQPLLVLAAGVPFLGLFSQLLVEQYHPTLQLVPYYAIGGGALVAWLWSAGKPRRRALAAFAVTFAVVWEMRELVRFDKAFLPRDDAKTVAAYLNANDHQVVVYTNSIIDAPFRFYFQRHGLGLATIAAGNIPPIIDKFFSDHGDAEPVHAIIFSDVEKTAFDKGLYALFSPKKRWSWVADPYGHRAEWDSSVAAGDRETVAMLEQVGTKVVDTNGLDLVRIRRADLDAYLLKLIGDEDTPDIDFGDVSSFRHKSRGFSFSEKYPGQAGFTWTTERQLKHYRFTMKGLKQDPVGPVVREAIATVRTRHASRVTFRALAAVAGQRVDVSMNGRRLATVDVGIADWSDLTVDIPSDALDESGLQRIGLAWAMSSEHGYGIALQWLRLHTTP